MGLGPGATLRRYPGAPKDGTGESVELAEVEAVEADSGACRSPVFPGGFSDVFHMIFPCFSHDLPHLGRCPKVRRARTHPKSSI